MSKKEKSGKHDCPKIDKDLWNVKVTGPAYSNAMTAEQARSAWFAFLRLQEKAVKKMPRKTF